MALNNKVIDSIKVIEDMMFYYEIIESIEFSELQDDKIVNFILNIVDEKLKVMLGNTIYNEYIVA